MEKDLISVIIPMYNMEKFIAKCLDSVCAQSYKNLEIICVNDGSPDRSAEIAEEYAKKDSRIIVHHNPQNMGLFRARVEGYKISKGKFIANVDADDFIAVDWFRLLHKKAVQEDADMTLGNTVNVNEEGVFDYYNNYRSLTTSHKTIDKKDLLSTFFHQEGSCFVWHTVWNKLYTKRLIDECMPYFEKIDFRLIMGEDIAFSSVLYSHANKLAFANVDAYFYYRHSAASTSTALPLEKILNNIRDLKKVFEFLEGSLKEYSPALYEKHLSQIVSFKDRYHRIWSGNVWAKGAQNDKSALDAINYTFGKKELVVPTPHEFYFYELTTPWSHRFEKIKQEILKDNIKVVSFDIFDTLIKRPLYEPTDIFQFVGKFAQTLLSSVSETTFCDMRKMADAIARQKLKQEKPMFEDVTLSEIYDAMAEYYGIDKKITDKIKAEEIRLELKLCTARNSAKEIFELAISAGKKVVITSDMYLEKDLVEQILKNNGYVDYDKLFLSSEERLLKVTGKLFEKMLKEVGVKPNEVVHIGDNWNVDYVTAESKGINVIFFPKAIETFENKISDIYAGGSSYAYLTKADTTIDTTEAIKQLPFRCMIGLVANEIFDNPFNFYQQQSAYNGDCYNAGFYTLGMHLFGVAKWMLDTATESGYKNIVFLERDGHLLKQIFDILKEVQGSKISTSSFYATRKALMPYSIKEKKDFYNLVEFMDIKEHTPLDLLEYLSVVIKPLTEDAKKQYYSNGIILDNKFTSKKEFDKFIDTLIKVSYDEKLLKSKRKEAEDAFAKTFAEKTATFDIGYSGRLQSIICDLAGKPVDAFFIHSNGYNTKPATKHKFKIHSFYDYSPTITAIIREFLISDQSPSCVGYAIKNKEIVPVFEDKVFAYETTYALKEFHKGAFNFCEKLISVFGEYITEFKMRSAEVSAPFEYYLLNAKEFDRYAFSSSLVEDNIYGGYDARSIFDIWTWHLNHLDRRTSAEANVGNSRFVHVRDGRLGQTVEEYLNNKSKFKRALFFLIFDRKLFKEKFKKNTRKQK